MNRYRLPALNKGYQGEWVQHPGKYYPEVLKYYGVLGTIYLRRRMGRLVEFPMEYDEK